MKVLQVIHGYPMRYNAGSEVYTQTLCHGLSDRHEVHVFTREEDPFAPDCRLRAEPDPDDAQITLHVVNNPRNRDRYREPGIDRRFAEVIDGAALERGRARGARGRGRHRRDVRAGAGSCQSRGERGFIPCQGEVAGSAARTPRGRTLTALHSPGATTWSGGHGKNPRDVS